MASAHDALAAAHEALRQASEQALNEKTARIAETEDKLSKLSFQQKFDLLDFKTLQPEIFKGRHHETFKPWARKVKAFCKFKQQGFRKALDWAEAQQHEIHDVSGMGWDRAAAANERLHDFLLQHCVHPTGAPLQSPVLQGCEVRAAATPAAEPAPTADVDMPPVWPTLEESDSFDSATAVDEAEATRTSKYDNKKLKVLL